LCPHLLAWPILLENTRSRRIAVLKVTRAAGRPVVVLTRAASVSLLQPRAYRIEHKKSCYSLQRHEVHTKQAAGRWPW
jgi:hypothetical protein